MTKLKIINRIIALFVFFFVSETVFSQITYTKKDSLKVVNLLKDGLKQKKNKMGDMMLYYGHKLIGIPYVPATLEVNPTEQLVVNLCGLDCTTFVETVAAFCLTTDEGSVKWVDYCKNLKKIRYNNGVMNGYPSRNHYFLWWVESNRRQGLVSMPMKKELCRKQTIMIDWMTKHPDAYPMLRGNVADINLIRKHERESTGKTMMYIPRSNLGFSKSKLNFVENGDILAICTKKKGLDTSHIGIAEWGSDGKLHLLNASQIHKKVVLEPMTLKQYMTKHPSQLGVWVLRLKNLKNETEIKK